MVTCDLANLVASIENVEYEDELKIVIQAVKRKENELKETNTKKQERITIMSALFSDWQKMTEKKLETLYNNFHSNNNSMYIKITGEDMAECLERTGYKVERPHEDEDENSLIGDFYFTLSELKFCGMYLDHTNDVIIPLEL